MKFKVGDLVKAQFVYGTEVALVLYPLQTSGLPDFLLPSNNKQTYMVWCPYTTVMKHELREMDLSPIHPQVSESEV